MARSAIDGDVSKLPKWAQRKIEILKMQLREAREELEARGPEGSNTFANPYSDFPLALGKDTHVGFYLNESDYFKVTLRRDRPDKRPYLEVHGTYRYGREMLVGSRATNVIEVHLVERS